MTQCSINCGRGTAGVSQRVTAERASRGMSLAPPESRVHWVPSRTGIPLPAGSFGKAGVKQLAVPRAEHLLLPARREVLRGAGRASGLWHQAAQVALSPSVSLIVTRRLALSSFPQQNWPFPVQRLNRPLAAEFSPWLSFASPWLQQQPQRIYAVKPPS